MSRFGFPTLHNRFSAGRLKFLIRGPACALFLGASLPLHALYTIVYDGTLTHVVSGLTNPNGLASALPAIFTLPIPETIAS